jgi:DNA-binding MarR family transcriptional regulator
MQMAADTDLVAAVDARLVALIRFVRSSYGGLSRTAASVLAHLRDAGPQRVTDLAAAEAVAQPSMTALVGRLERAGLVRRGPDPDDARAVRVSLTDAGVERLTGIRETRRAQLEARLAALDPEERAALAAALPALDSLIASGGTTK